MVKVVGSPRFELGSLAFPLISPEARRIDQATPRPHHQLICGNRVKSLMTSSEIVVINITII